MIGKLGGKTDLLTQEQIDWCEKKLYEYVSYNDYFVNDDGEIESNIGIVNFLFDIDDSERFEKFPVKFANCDLFSGFSFPSFLSLDGSPDVVNDYFSCIDMNGLKSFSGGPKNVRNFYCKRCNSLESLDGIADNISGYLKIEHCVKLNDVMALRDVKGDFEVHIDDDNRLSPEIRMVVNEKTLLKMWQRSRMMPDEFLKKYPGFINGYKYGI